MSEQIWQKRSNGDYDLSMDYDSTWFAVVFKYDGRWVYRLGTRVKEGGQQKTFRSKGSWASAATAKQKALRSLVKVKHTDRETIAAGEDR